MNEWRRRRHEPRRPPARFSDSHAPTTTGEATTRVDRQQFRAAKLCTKCGRRRRSTASIGWRLNESRFHLTKSSPAAVSASAQRLFSSHGFCCRHIQHVCGAAATTESRLFIRPVRHTTQTPNYRCRRRRHEHRQHATRYLIAVLRRRWTSFWHR